MAGPWANVDMSFMDQTFTEPTRDLVRCTKTFEVFWDGIHFGSPFVVQNKQRGSYIFSIR